MVQLPYFVLEREGLQANVLHESPCCDGNHDSLQNLEPRSQARSLLDGPLRIELGRHIGAPDKMHADTRLA